MSILSELPVIYCQSTYHVVLWIICLHIYLFCQNMSSNGQELFSPPLYTFSQLYLIWCGFSSLFSGYTLVGQSHFQNMIPRTKHNLPNVFYREGKVLFPCDRTNDWITAFFFFPGNYITLSTYFNFTVNDILKMFSHVLKFARGFWLSFSPHLFLQRQCSSKFIFWVIRRPLKHIHAPIVNKNFNKWAPFHFASSSMICLHFNYTHIQKFQVSL